MCIQGHGRSDALFKLRTIAVLHAVYIEGYKGLHEVDIENLAVINIVVGQSSSGKTALLEAIKIALSGNPSTMWTTSVSRGSIAYLPPNSTGEQFEASWKQFFTNFDSDSLIRLWVKDTEDRTASVSIVFDRNTSMTWSVESQQGGPSHVSTYSPLVFDRKNFDGSISRLSSFMNAGQGLHMEQGPELGIPSEFISSSITGNSYAIADWFSALSIEDLEHDIVRTICNTFPTVSGLSVQSPNGFAQLYATLNTINRKLPVTAISSGITKFITILLAMNIRRGGVVLIDEIENAIYFKMFPQLWRTIIYFAVLTDTQIIASSHSWECLSAAATAFEEYPDLLTLLQVSSEDGVTQVNNVDGKDAINAIKGDLEVRR